MPPHEATQLIDVNSHFKLIFATITGLTVFFVILYFILCCLINSPNDMQKNFTRMLQLLIPLGFGAICGLIGGKSL